MLLSFVFFFVSYDSLLTFCIYNPYYSYAGGRTTTIYSAYTKNGKSKRVILYQFIELLLYTPIVLHLKSVKILFITKKKYHLVVDIQDLTYLFMKHVSGNSK